MSDKPKQPKIVRAAAEVQYAHDLIATVVCVPEVREAMLAYDSDPALTEKCMKAALDVLCWVLGHANRTNTFELNLRGVEHNLRVMGIEMRDLGELHWVGENHDGPLPS